MWTVQVFKTLKIKPHVKALEEELKKNPSDEMLRMHIKQLRKAWGLRLPKKAAA